MESDGMSNMSFLWFKESARIFMIISKCTQLLYDNETIFIAYIYFDGHLTRYDNVYHVCEQCQIRYLKKMGDFIETETHRNTKCYIKVKIETL